MTTKTNLTLFYWTFSCYVMHDQTIDWTPWKTVIEAPTEQAAKDKFIAHLDVLGYVVDDVGIEITKGYAV